MQLMYFILSVWGVTEFMRRFGLQAWQAPYFAICVGGFLGFLDAQYRSGIDWQVGMMEGIFYGLVATGLYAVLTHMIRRIKKDTDSKINEFSRQEIH